MSSHTSRKETFYGRREIEKERVVQSARERQHLFRPLLAARGRGGGNKNPGNHGCTHSREEEEEVGK